MIADASRAIHRATCRDEECPACERQAEERAESRDEDPGYADDWMDNVVEREMEAMWP